MNLKPWNALLVVAIYCACCSTSKNTVKSIEINKTPGPKPWSNLNWNNKSENFQFVVVTDRTGGMRPGVFEQGVEKVNLLQPEFVMSVGDLIQGYTEDLTELNRQWNEFDQLVDQLEMPFFYVPGNHDITNRTMEDLWKQRYGDTYYHFVYKDVLFLCLNGEEAVPDTDTDRGNYNTRDFYLSPSQRNYVSETLDAHQDVRWTFVFWHKPVWLYEGSDNPQLSDWIPQSGWPEIEAMLQGRKHTVFAGHIHRYVHQTRNDADYITLATTGGGSNLGGPIFGQFDHVLWVTMTDEGPVMANLLLKGIFDKEFNQDDIEKHLELALQKKVMRIDTKFDESKPLANQILKFTLFNPQDQTVEVSLDIPTREHVSFANPRRSWSIPPNSAQIVETQIAVGEASSEIQWNEFKSLYARWTLTLEVEKYGKIEVSGNTRLYN